MEEILVATRTQRSPRLSSYYHHWEANLFSAIGEISNHCIILTRYSHSNVFKSVNIMYRDGELVLFFKIIGREFMMF